MELRVKSPVIVAVPFKRVVPSTPKVVEGAAVPMPTLDSLTFTTRVLLVEPPRDSEVVVNGGRAGDKDAGSGVGRAEGVGNAGVLLPGAVLTGGAASQTRAAQQPVGVYVQTLGAAQDGVEGQIPGNRGSAVQAGGTQHSQGGGGSGSANADS